MKYKTSDYNQYTSGSVAELLIFDNFINEINMAIIIERLKKETEKQGLRSSDISDLTGWSSSKISKLISGRQKLTAEDVRNWARALGYTPDPFVGDEVDFRHYMLSSYIRKPSEIFKVCFNISNENPEYKAMIYYELPLSILSMLEVNTSDYVVKAEVSEWCIDPRLKKSVGKTSTSVRFWQRTTGNNDDMIPEFGLWISPENDYLVLAVYLNDTTERYDMTELRARYKNRLQIKEKYTVEFDKIAKDNKEWLPRFLRKGEIAFASCGKDFLLQLDNLEDTLIDFFQKYCALVWEMMSVDLLPEKYKQNEPFNILESNRGFRPDVKEEIIKREKFKCENDPSHNTFINADGMPYMDTAPIVPFTKEAQFGKAILSAHNGICLCPICKAQLQYGKINDREDMMIKLFRKHQESLLNIGIKVSLTQVLEANGLA